MDEQRDTLESRIKILESKVEALERHVCAQQGNYHRLPDTPSLRQEALRQRVAMKQAKKQERKIRRTARRRRANARGIGGIFGGMLAIPFEMIFFDTVTFWGVGVGVLIGVVFGAMFRLPTPDEAIQQATGITT